jgi:hypothetical protein
MKNAILITMALASVAQADLPIFVRDPNKPSSIQRGSVNGHAVILDIYGRDSIQAAQRFGRSLVGHHSFAESKQLIESRAEELYHNQGPLVQFFERDAAFGYDQEVRVSR